MSHKITIAHTDLEWVDSAVKTILSQATEAIKRSGYYTLVLSGGNTPKPIYRELASSHLQSVMDWRKIYIFWGDERCVPPTDLESNFLMAKTALLDLVPIPSKNIFRIKGELQPEKAARDYEKNIESFFVMKEKRFDTTLLGLGEDGHTASLFPDTIGLQETTRWVVPNLNPHSNTNRITLTFPALNSSRNIIFLVKGAEKAEIVADIIHNPNSPPRYPAKNISGKEIAPHWIIDTAAAKNL